MKVRVKIKSKNEILRPKTRGELYDALKNNIRCEIVASNEGITSLLLQSLASLKREEIKFQTYQSETEGWVVYENINKTIFINEEKRDKIIGMV